MLSVKVDCKCLKAPSNRKPLTQQVTVSYSFPPEIQKERLAENLPIISLRKLLYF